LDHYAFDTPRAALNLFRSLSFFHQDRLIALHHLDVPWCPSDVGQILLTFKIKKNVEVTNNGKDDF
jgi:hypothetical protein